MWNKRQLDCPTFGLKIITETFEKIFNYNQDIWTWKIDCSYRDDLKYAAVVIQLFFMAVSVLFSQ
jgi:hypothetical protein